MAATAATRVKMILRDCRLSQLHFSAVTGLRGLQSRAWPCESRPFRVSPAHFWRCTWLFLEAGKWPWDRSCVHFCFLCFHIHLPFGLFLMEVLPMFRCIFYLSISTELPNYAGSNDCGHGLEVARTPTRSCKILAWWPQRLRCDLLPKK